MTRHRPGSFHFIEGKKSAFLSSHLSHRHLSAKLAACNIGGDYGYSLSIIIKSDVSYEFILVVLSKCLKGVVIHRNQKA